MKEFNAVKRPYSMLAKDTRHSHTQNTNSPAEDRRMQSTDVSRGTSSFSLQQCAKQRNAMGLGLSTILCRSREGTREQV